jgi:hypothetical protein
MKEITRVLLKAKVCTAHSIQNYRMWHVSKESLKLSPHFKAYNRRKFHNILCKCSYLPDSWNRHAINNSVSRSAVCFIQRAITSPAIAGQTT